MNNLLKTLDPYIRLGRFDKPIGAWLGFWPASYAIVLNSTYGFINPFWMGCAVAASFMLRAGGCAGNDILDRKLDIQVERTKTRPIASGEISIAKGAAFCAFNMAPVPVLWYLFDPSMMAVLYMTAPAILIYPLSKRFMKHPQFALGISMNYGFINAYAFMAGHLDLCVLPFMAGLWCWTVLYDTIYALQDLNCDKKVGNNSTAVAWEGQEMKIFDRLTVGMATSLAFAGYLAQLGTLYYPTLAFAIWQFSRTWVGLDLKDLKACNESFKKNHQIGGYIFIALLLGKLSQKKTEEKGVKLND